MTPASGSGGRCVLIVEDDSALARFLEILFAQQGWRTVAVETGERALQVFLPGTFSNVLCDIDLGEGIDGVEVARRLRRSEPGINVLFLTGSRVQASWAAETAPVLLKPFSPARLLTIMEQGG